MTETSHDDVCAKQIYKDFNLNTGIAGVKEAEVINEEVQRATHFMEQGTEPRIVTILERGRLELSCNLQISLTTVHASKLELFV